MKLERSAPLTLPRHRDAPEGDKFDEWCAAERKSGRPLAVDLFSGAGGLGAGVEAAGWAVIAAVDHDKAALETHRANFRGQALEVDMSDPAQVRALIERLSPLGVDLVAGGPPCQPFSRAGRAKIRSLVKGGMRDAVDTRKELWRSFIDVVLALRPRAVLMENVPDMAIGDDLIVIREIADILEQADYVVDYRLLDAWRHGVPQHRKRFILQARSDSAAPQWPALSDKKPTVRDAIADLPSLNGTTGARESVYSGAPTSVLAVELRGDDATGVVHDHMTRPVRDDDREAFELMDSSTLYSDLPERLKRYRSDTFNDKYKRLDWEDLSRTITAHIAKDGYWYIHPAEHRTLTVREAARIQTFPDSFRFSGTRSDAFRQIGNAVPPILGRAVAESIRPIDPQEVGTEDGVDRMLASDLRQRLEAWAVARRPGAWWLFPGPEMTAVAAAFGALLEVNQLVPAQAQVAMAPFRGATRITVEARANIKAAKFTPARRKAVDRALERLQDESDVEEAIAMGGLLRPLQQDVFRMLRGGNQLITSERVADVVSTLLALPKQQRGQGTDIKVALAQLVGAGENAALRMAAIRVLTKQEAALLARPGEEVHADEGEARAS